MIGTGWPLPAQLQDQVERQHGGKYMLSPRLAAAHDSERLTFEVSEEDWRKVGKGPTWNGAEVDVTDLRTGKVYRIAGAPCTYPTCFCDAVVVGSRADS